MGYVTRQLDGADQLLNYLIAKQRDRAKGSECQTPSLSHTHTLSHSHTMCNNTIQKQTDLIMCCVVCDIIFLKTSKWQGRATQSMVCNTRLSCGVR